MDQDALIKRCQKYAGASGAWTPDNLSGFLGRFRPDGKGLSEIYAGVPFGPEIVRRLRAVMEVDGTGAGLSLSVNNPLDVDEAKALTIVKKFFAKMRKLGEELGEQEMVDLFPPSLNWIARPGELQKHRDNRRTNDVVRLICDIMDGALLDSANAESAAVVMNEAIYTLVYDFPLLYYIQWPIYADDFKTSDPFHPWFEMWRRKVKWRFVSGHDVEVFLP